MTMESKVVIGVGILNALLIVGQIIVGRMLGRADRERAGQTAILNRLEGASNSQGQTLAVHEARLDGHDRELGRLSSSIYSDRRNELRKD